MLPVAETFFLFLREHIHCSALGGLWLRFCYLGKRENDFTILAETRKRFCYLGWLGICFYYVSMDVEKED